jgi:hypothetical protein
MVEMRRHTLITAAVTALAAALAPSAASASIFELGQTASPIVAPTCPPGAGPGNCLIVLTRTTAVQTTSDGVVNPTRVRRAGFIVAFTIGLSQLSTNPKTERSILHVLDTAWGGTARVALTVLKPGPNHTYTVTAESPVFHVEPYLGSVSQLPLSLPPTFSSFNALRVVPGDVIGLTVPTWAPVLSYNLSPSGFTYRQSRRAANCAPPATVNTAQLTVGSKTQYLCNYTGTRVEYSATEVTTKPYPRKYVHPPRRPHAKPRVH